MEPHRGSGHGGRLLCLEEKRQFHNCQRNLCRSWWLLAGSEIWVLKLSGVGTLGCFSNVVISPHPCPAIVAFGGATPRFTEPWECRNLRFMWVDKQSRKPAVVVALNGRAGSGDQTQHNSPGQSQCHGDSPASATCEGGNGTARRHSQGSSAQCWEHECVTAECVGSPLWPSCHPTCGSPGHGWPCWAGHGQGWAEGLFLLDPGTG